MGKRISLGLHKGTVRYRGPVPPSKGEWLGIEWDDPTRGKHDGTSADGTRYFHVRIPGSGSFIRPTASKLSSGCCLVAALRNKYLTATADPPAVTDSVGSSAHRYSRKNIAEIEIETPNLDRIAVKAARLDRLREVSLGGWQQSALPEVDAESVHDARYDVSRAFDEAQGFGPGSIRATCPNIRWLDLSRSLLPDWEEVSLIAAELSQLRTLLLHFNRLQSPPTPLPVSWRERLGHVEDLRLDGTLIEWSDVTRLSEALPSLRSLHLSSNEVVSLVESGDEASGKQEYASIFPSLTSLSLEDNAIESWSELVAAVSHLPSLEALNLDRNRISTIPPASASSCKLPKLKELHLRSNSVDKWSSLEHIAQWLGPETTFEALHVSTLHDDEADGPSSSNHNTGELLSKYEYRDFRALVIARLPTLKVLDKTEITPKERKDAELFVYTRFREGDAYIIDGEVSRQGEDGKLELTMAEKVSKFPRFLELAKAFDDEGVLATPPAQQGEKKSNTLRSKMLTVKVIASASAPSATRPYVTHTIAEKEINLLASTSLRLLKMKLASAVGVKVTQVRQVLVMMKPKEDAEERIVVEIDDMSRSLDWYEVAVGDALVLVVEDRE